MSTTKNVAYNAIPQEDVGYVTVSPFTGDEQCANCLFFNPVHVDIDRGVQPTSCKIVEPYPLAILATGHCERYEAIGDIEEDALLVEIKREAPAPATYITPKPLREGIADKLLKRDKSDVLFGRAPDGMRLAVLTTSNGYEDREQEYVATKALQKYVDECYKQNGDDIEYIGDNPHLFWHDENLHIGDIVHADMFHGFLVELSKERDNPIAHRMWDKWEATTQDGSYRWGTSHKFPPLITEIHDGKKVYQKIKKLETSTLLWDAAANQLTISEVIPMAKSKEELLNEWFPEVDDAYGLIQEGPAGLAKLAASQGLEAKEKTDDANSDEATIQAPDVTIVLDKVLDRYVEIVEAQADLDGRIETQATVAKDHTESYEDIEKRVAAVETFMADTPGGVKAQRVSNTTAKKVADLKDKAGPVEINRMYGDANVPLKRGDNHDN